MAKIHPTAQVDTSVELGEGVEIGPWCVLRGKVVLEEGVRLLGNVSIQGPVRVGARTTLYPFACLGYPPQDFKFALGGPTGGVQVGEDCVLREHVTIHAATSEERPTRIGRRVMMMVASHAAHDVSVGDDAVIVNAVLLAGHVEIGAGSVLGGAAVFHQHIRVGRLAMVSGGSRLSTEVPPFCVATGRNLFNGVNVIGLRRAGIDREEISIVRRACREVFRSRVSREEMLSRLEFHAATSPLVGEVLEFVRTAKRPLATGSGPGTLSNRRLVETEA